MKGQIHSLLIGINEYPSPNELSGCLGDVKKFERYITNLSSTHKKKISEPLILLDSLATKSNIVTALKELVEVLSSDDVLLFYYSGHGAQQLTGGKFLDDYNGLHQCLVCHHQDSQEKDYLLADNEIRYLFNLCKSNAHIVAIFDCCHSGEITRSIDNQKRLRRMSKRFPARPVDYYIFNQEADFQEFAQNKFESIFPDANVITLSASLSNEFSWEDSNGGVFTRILIDILKQKKGFINYNELIRQSQLAIRLTTKERQTPSIGILGNRKFNQLTSWLCLNGNELRISSSYISYNKKLGWIFSKGSLMGCKPGDKIKIKVDEDATGELELIKVDLTSSLLEDTLDYNFNLDKRNTYAAIINSELPKPRVFIKNIDNDRETYLFLEKLLKNSQEILLVSSLEECDYELNIFNQQVYLSFQNQSFKPISKQFDLIGKNEHTIERRLVELESSLKSDIEILTRWFQLKNLNLDDTFIEVPIKTEIKFNDIDSWVDITQGSLSLEPISRHDGSDEFYSEYDIRVRNTTNEDIFITVFALFDSRHEISAYPFDERTILLKPNKTASFENFIALDHYQEFYNWACEKVVLKFFVNNHSVLTQEISSFTQHGFSKPITLEEGDARGGGPPSKFQAQKKNAVYTSEITLNNPTRNQITGLLSANLDDVLKNELVQPYIERLYLEVETEGLFYSVSPKPTNLTDKEYAIKGGNLKMNIGNLIDYNRRNRKFKKLLKRFPEKPIIVAEGDSWFLYPILVKDTLDYVMESWPLKSLAWAGDTLENYKKSGQLLKYVKKLSPKFVFISGGGNDIIGSEIQQLLKKDVVDAKKPMDYLNDKFEKQMDKLEEYYNYFFTKLIKYPSVDKIVVHGYDYVRADHAKIVTKGGWINKYLENAGIHDYKEREKLIKFLIDEFNTLLERTSRDFEKVTYLNLRGLIDMDEWFDEIHPNNEGYKKVADRFLSAIN